MNTEADAYSYKGDLQGKISNSQTNILRMTIYKTESIF